MDCNRDEALRAKEFAEKKLASQDYHGALKLLQKALQLFPGLENTSQISTVLDVHIAAQMKINGSETDWYGILQVDPGADDIVIKKQYKRLALLLHPDKNKYAGAEAAFKLVGEASQVLSDKQQRMLFDSRRKQRSKGGNTTQRKQSRQKNYHSYATKPAAVSNTFITVCPSCQIRYQYYRVYENQNLLCQQCNIPFLARDCYPNVTYGAHGFQPFSEAQPGFNSNTFEPFASAANFASGMPYTSETLHGGAQKVGVPGGGSTADYVKQMSEGKARMDKVAEDLKRKRDNDKNSEKEMRRVEKEQQKKAKADQRAQEILEKKMGKRRKKAEKNKKRRHLSDSSDEDDDDDDDDDDDGGGDNSGSVEDLSNDEMLNHVAGSKSAPRRSSRTRRNVTYKVDVSDDDEVAPTKTERETINVEQMHTFENSKIVQDGESATKQKLADTVKLNIQVNFAKSTASVEVDDSPKVGNLKASEVHRTGRSSNGLPETKAKIEPTESSVPSEAEEDKIVHEADEETDTECEHGADDEAEEEEEEESEKFAVPDSEFHDFDADRKNVKAGQIWASYDDVDGLPRFYLKVKEVRSQDPFRVSIIWLELQNLSADQQALKKLGFLPTCGDSFKTTSAQVLDSMDMLSHILKWEKGPKGTVIIYPRKGDVWALHRNWTPRLRTKKKSLLQEYDMVEVLTDFNKQAGVSVVCLEKLPERKTLFKRSEVRMEILAAELCRFSYQVPAYMLREDEAPGKEKGYWELDPASIPLTEVFQGSGESTKP